MKLTLQKSSDDWFVIERAEHDNRVWLEQLGPGAAALRSSSRFSDADVEGTAEEMLAIAEAIEKRGEVNFRRCAVRLDGPHVYFWSPRNSQSEGECTLEEADELAKEIRQKLADPTALEQPAPPKLVDHAAAVRAIAAAAQTLSLLDLPKVLEDAQRALDIGALFHPTAWIQNHQRLEQDIETLRAALPLYHLADKLTAVAAAEPRIHSHMPGEPCNARCRPGGSTAP